MQTETEQRKIDQEVDPLRKSLAIELRQLVARALKAHELLKRLSEMSPSRPGWWKVCREFPPRSHILVIGLLKDDTMDVVIIYNLIDIARESAAQLMRYRTPDIFTPSNVAGVSEVFLQVCIYAQGVLPKLKTGVAPPRPSRQGLVRKD